MKEDRGKLVCLLSSNLEFWLQGRQARCEEGLGSVLEESKCSHIGRTVERECGMGVCPEWEVGDGDNGGF